MMGLGNLSWLLRRLLRLKGKNRVAYHEERLVDTSRDNYSAYGYESPRLMVIGPARKFSTGSSSSGNADANSQYYW
jgi:hypothetical protein